MKKLVQLVFTEYGPPVPPIIITLSEWHRRLITNEQRVSGYNWCMRTAKEKLPEAYAKCMNDMKVEEKRMAIREEVCLIIIIMMIIIIISII